VVVLGAMDKKIRGFGWKGIDPIFSSILARAESVLCLLMLP
jgi:hypothetical protein